MEIPINLVVEDDLSEAIARELLSQSTKKYSVGVVYKKQGNGYIRKHLPMFNHAAKFTPYFVLTDLDNMKCPLELINKQINFVQNNNLIFRIAVKEVESWVMAHRLAFAKFLNVDIIRIPENVDSIKNPKEFLIRLAKSSPNVLIRNSIIPAPNSNAKKGPDYNGKLIDFTLSAWKAKDAAKYSKSLSRAMNAIKNFKLKKSE